MSHTFDKQLLNWKRQAKNLRIKINHLQETVGYLDKKIEKREKELKEKKGVQMEFDWGCQA